MNEDEDYDNQMENRRVRWLITFKLMEAYRLNKKEEAKNNSTERSTTEEILQEMTEDRSDAAKYQQTSEDIKEDINPTPLHTEHLKNTTRKINVDETLHSNSVEGKHSSVSEYDFQVDKSNTNAGKKHKRPNKIKK